jgi:primosomal replication protein N
VTTNSLVLTAVLSQVESLRYTPAGIPALNITLEHSSEVVQVGVKRAVGLEIKALAFGVVAEQLAKQALGSHWKFNGFLANARQGKNVVFHIQEFLQV